MNELATKEDLEKMCILLVSEIKAMLSHKKSVDQDNEPQEWIRSKEIRRILDISAGTLQNLRITGKVRHKKIMGSYYYNTSDLMELFKQEK